MTGPSARHKATVKGTNAANRQVIRLGIDPNFPVDIFGTIEQSRVWFLFKRLDNLFGFFQRSGETAGIVVNSGHPLSLQRFTAAHEYGHYVLGHTFSHDGDAEVLGSPNVPVQEIEAHAFAAEFLMPLPLVNRALTRLSLPETPKQIDPVEAYQLSLEIGASYRATVARLSELNKVSRQRADLLRGYEPKQLKIEVGGGQKPANPRAAVWAIDRDLQDRHLNMRIEDELHVRLPEIPSSGYRWALADSSDTKLELVADVLERIRPRGDRLGGSVTRHFWWRAVEPGTGLLRLRLIRQWEATPQAADALTVPLSVQIPHNDSPTGTGIALPQREAMLVAA